MATPAFPNGPPTWPLPDEDVRAALLACYASGDWGKYDGANTALLLQALREQFHREHVLLCSSGTIAVELALRGLKVGPGDEVILAGYDFPGNFRAIEAVGARPVLVDVLPNRWTIDPLLIDGAVSPQTKAVIVSHLHGDLAEIETICRFAGERGLKVLEDACQVPGALLDGKPAGSFGDVSTLSFGGSKLLTAGRGGAVLTSQAEVAQRIRVFSQRGNEAFPLSELQAAVLLPQLRKLQQRAIIRAQNAQRLRDRLQDVGELQPAEAGAPTESLAAYYKFPWRYLPAVNNAQADCSHPSRDAVIGALQAQGIAIDAGFRGFTKRSGNRCRVMGDLVHSQSAAEATLLLHHPILLSDIQQLDLLVNTMRKVIAGAD
jgi:dTDP-4-amino-4,6-dideoxygalactose transaminase